MDKMDLNVIAKVLLPPLTKVSSLIKSNNCEGFRTLVHLHTNRLMPGDSVCIKEHCFILSDKRIHNMVEGYTQIKFNYINNPDGTMRWFLPDYNTTGNFANLYNSVSWKKKVLQVLNRINVNGLFNKVLYSGSFYLYTKSLDEVSYIKKGLIFSVFTGTPGPNRKAVVEITEQGSTVSFTKIPIGEQSAAIIQNELRIINKVKELNLALIKVPEIVRSNGALALSNIKPDQLSSLSNFSTLHLLALKELAEKTVLYKRIESTHFFRVVEDQIAQLTPDERIPESAALVEMVKMQWESINRYEIISLSFAHGDFTPWNMYVSENNLHVFDWELSNGYMPMLFDLFHYILQEGILIKRQTPVQLLTEVSLTLQRAEMIRFREQFGIKSDLYFKLYLIYISSYYLNLYRQQSNLHEQVQWLAGSWCSLLSELKRTENSAYSRERFMQSFSQFLQGVPHAVLAKGEPIIYKTDGDIDLVIPRNHMSLIRNYISAHPYIAHFTWVSRSNMETLNLYLVNGSFISFDFIFEFKRRHIRYLDVMPLLASAVENESGFRIADARYQVEFIILFYWLNNSSLGEKQFSYFNTLTVTDKKRVLSYLNHKYSISCSDLSLVGLYRSQILRVVDSNNRALPVWAKLKDLFLYTKDVITSKFSGGFVVTLSGVDGAGKSTIVEDLKAMLTKHYRKDVVVLRHRPGLLPILSSFLYGKSKAELRTTVVLPRTGTNSSLLSSWVRFFYYYVDYLLGQFFVQFLYVSRGKVVIYDRYYFDFINDAKRSNIQLPAVYSRFLYRFLLKPDYNYFLYADPNTILSRKRELDYETIESLTNRYLFLFKEFNLKYKGGYTSIKNLRKQETLSSILGQLSFRLN